MKVFPNGKWAAERVFPADKAKGWKKVVADLFGDVNMLVNGKMEPMPVAVEVQVSNMTSSKYLKKITEYDKRNVVVLWIKPLTGELGVKHRPKMVERLVHALNFGCVYYWQESFGGFLLPVKYEDIKGYKALKKPVAEDLVPLEDFIVKVRESFRRPVGIRKSLRA